MSRWVLAAGVLACAVAALVPAGAVGAERGALARFSPIVVHAEDEPSPLTSVEAFAGRVPGVPAGEPEPTVYGRRDGPWLQYWLLFAENAQDRGVLRTGRHEGDWEMVQYRVRSGELVRGVYAQHAGAESCGIDFIRTSRGHPVVFLARGSHAAYFRPGVRDRTWPDPNDEADGRGTRVRPRLVRISEDAPPWMRYPGPWGATSAGWVPGEMSSPRGPAFQPERWDAAGWAAAAQPCTKRDCDRRGECDGRETAMAAVLALLGLLVAGWFAVRRARRSVAAAA